MSETTFKNHSEGDLVLSNRYRVLRQVLVGEGSDRILLGRRRTCRFCAKTDPRKFRKTSHTFPQALGNKWLISLDECDDCNDKFSLYESSLVSCMSPFLTLGGVPGGKAVARQTGRTGKQSTIRHEIDDSGARRLSVTAEVADATRCVGWDAARRKLVVEFPVAAVPFRPRLAYKALSKMAFALLPESEWNNFSMLRSWILDTRDEVEFPILEVAMSFASIGNSPPLLSGMLLRRENASDTIPYIYFIMTAGSLCLQCDLLSDCMDDHISASKIGDTYVGWKNTIVDKRGSIELPYVNQIHRNWSSKELEPQPVEAFTLEFCPLTTLGKLTPVFREIGAFQ